MPLLSSKTRNQLKLWFISKTDRSRPKFECPLCGYQGWFTDTNNRDLGTRKHSRCPECNALERHRFIFLALKERINIKDKKVLHFAPEQAISKYIRSQTNEYHTSNYDGKNADFKADMTKLPFENESYDIVLACHVMEHIQDDSRALQEIHRVLKPGGIAILPVPLTAEETIEYPRPLESGGHWRAPGMDYFQRYEKVFPRCELLESADFPEKYQIYTYENRKKWPTKKAPLLKPMREGRFIDVIPLCHKS